MLSGRALTCLALRRVPGWLDPQSYPLYHPFKNWKIRKTFSHLQIQKYCKDHFRVRTRQRWNPTLKSVYSGLMHNNHNAEAIQVPTDKCPNKIEHLTTLEFYPALKSILVIINCRRDKADPLKSLSWVSSSGWSVGMSVSDCPDC